MLRKRRGERSLSRSRLQGKSQRCCTVLNPFFASTSCDSHSTVTGSSPSASAVRQYRSTLRQTADKCTVHTAFHRQRIRQDTVAFSLGYAAPPFGRSLKTEPHHAVVERTTASRWHQPPQTPQAPCRHRRHAFRREPSQPSCATWPVLRP